MSRFLEVLRWTHSTLAGSSQSLRPAVFLLAAWLVTDSLVAAEPFVPGYDRFHRQASATGGRLLLTELSCTACHRTQDRQLAPKRGPVLDRIAYRVNMQWLKDFLANPAKLKPGTTMPAVLDQFPKQKRARMIDALASFLAQGSKRAKNFKRISHKRNVKRGSRLFHSVGCIACHGSSQLKEVDSIDDGTVRPGRPLQRDRVRSVPFPNLKAKYSHAGLATFLIDPLAVRPSGRMPHLKLSASEASDIASFLTPSKFVAWQTDATLVAEGGKLFRRLGCADCHEFSKAKSAKAFPSLAKVGRSGNGAKGCLNGSDKKSPRFGLGRKQRISIIKALESLHTKKQPSKQSQLTDNLQRFNCQACHRRNKAGGPGIRRYAFFKTKNDVDIGDEGKVPPDLTGVGGKLTSHWLGRVMVGAGDVRPHMVTRMPYFGKGAGATVVKQLLAVDHPQPPKRVPSVFPGERHVNSGRLLAGTGCIQCHAIRGKRLPGVVGTDLTLVKDRIRPSWFRRFLLEPNKVRPRTRMPSFWPKGQATNRSILGGNTENQIASLWTYLASSKTEPLPLAMQKKDTFELRPTTRPIVFRTFFKGAGTHAVAVGFPEERHTVFDSRAVRFAFLWKGRFVDAHGTWFNRFQPLTSPLGKGIIALPNGPLLASNPGSKAWPSSLAANKEYRMIGYKLDRQGRPTFLYRWRNHTVHDSLQPNAKSNGMIRKIELVSEAKLATPIAMRVFVSKESIRQLTPSGSGASKKDRARMRHLIRVSNTCIIAIRGLPPIVRKSKGTNELLLFAKPTGKKIQIELEYLW